MPPSLAAKPRSDEGDRVAVPLDKKCRPVQPQRMETEMRSNTQDEQTVQNMADAMRGHGEGCTREDLNLHFTMEEIARFEAKARARANDQAVRELQKAA